MIHLFYGTMAQRNVAFIRFYFSGFTLELKTRTYHTTCNGKWGEI